jgi:hypothetical protein
VTFTHNIVRHAACGVNVSGGDTEAGPSLPSARVLIQNNLFADISSGLANGGCPGRLYSIDGIAGFPAVHDITIDHNTGFADGAFIFAVDTLANGQVPQNLNCVFTNNIANHGGFGVFGLGASSEGTASLNLYFPGHVFTKNVLIGVTGLEGFYTANTFFPASASAVGFVDFAGADYRLCLGAGNPAASCTASSPYASLGADGKDIGADINAVNAATAGVK